MEKKLGEVFSIFNGYAFPSHESSQNGAPWVKIADVGINEMKRDNLSFLPVNFKEKYSKFLLKKGDYVVALTRPVLSGKLKIAQIDDFFDGALLNQRVGKIESTNSNEFVYFYLQKEDLIKSIENNIAGSDPPNLSPSEINFIALSIPIISEQERIATCLSIIEQRISTQKKIIEGLQSLIQDLKDRLFTGQLRFKDKNGKKFPEWEKRTLRQIATKLSVKNKNNNVTNVFTNSASHGILNQKDFFDKEIANQNNLSNYYVVEKNNFVYNPRISNIAPVGPISRNHLDTGVMSPLYSVFRIEQGNLDFFEMYFSTNCWHEYMKSIANYGARHDRMSVTIEDFYLMPLPFPCVDEQIRIATFISSLLNKMKLEKNILVGYQQQKDFLLKELFI